MFDLKTAQNQARAYTALHGEKWIVMETPSDATCNQPGFNTFNTGTFIPVPHKEALDYAAGGCRIADLMLAA